METFKNYLKHVQPKHVIGFIVSLLITLAIILFAPELRKFEQMGYLGVFLIVLLGNATLILPAPGLVFVFLLGGALPNPLLVGIAAGIGGTIGELTGYLAGFGLNGVVTHTRMYKKTSKQIDTYGLWAIFFLALIPNPVFDIAGMIAGSVGIRWWKFLLAAGGGKLIKAIVTAYLGYYSLAL